ncbi:hypothetical protein [Oceanidesulfovibrio marinus]|uniref:GspE/PulE/PilB domain-containing protein n=1 Tax=Oceanidesulfovibrio marinus TaxID=370038 RepID=UPI00142EF936|nr:hypothetical protein [Oceanidesulfovibrio marinus]
MDQVTNQRAVPATVYFDEAIAPPESLAEALDFEALRDKGWVPLKRDGDWAWVATCRQEQEAVRREAQEMCGVADVSISAAGAEAIQRFIDHAEDLNPGFPVVAARTFLARTRTFLAAHRSQLSSYRTLLAKGRTGLAMLRTGLALIAIAMMLLKVFGAGWIIVPEAVLAICGVVLASEGLTWYLPARKLARKRLAPPEPPGPDVTVPVAVFDQGRIRISRSGSVPGAAQWMEEVERHSPVMRRRFLALERTELAMERTRQAHFRTVMAKSRTGMALVRTGIALTGLGTALMRRIHAHPMDVVDIGLLVVGVILILEGLSWYLSGHGAGRTSLTEAHRAGEQTSAWSMLTPPVLEENSLRSRSIPLISPGCSEGIWGSTGLALERTLLAERRNVMSRFRTSLACSRTGFAYIRTGVNFVAVGLGLLLTSPHHTPGWIIFDSTILCIGLLLLADGFLWHRTARRNRWQLSYCEPGMEIDIPDYTKPPGQWTTFELEHGQP